MIKLIDNLQTLGVKTKACCCGHDIYPMTIVVEWKVKGYFIEIVSGLHIPRKRKFYKIDKDGYYYIPEVIA